MSTPRTAIKSLLTTLSQDISNRQLQKATNCLSLLYSLRMHLTTSELDTINLIEKDTQYFVDTNTKRIEKLLQQE